VCPAVSGGVFSRQKTPGIRHSKPLTVYFLNQCSIFLAVIDQECGAKADENKFCRSLDPNAVCFTYPNRDACACGSHGYYPTRSPIDGHIHCSKSKYRRRNSNSEGACIHVPGHEYSCPWA
jgi:hypothetical protein